MSLKPGFYMIVTEIVSICRRLIGDTSPMCRSRSPTVKPGFHMIVTVGDASPRQARGHIGDGCVKWKHFLNDVADVADQTGTVWGRIERVEMSLKPGFYTYLT